MWGGGGTLLSLMCEKYKRTGGALRLKKPFLNMPFGRKMNEKSQTFEEKFEHGPCIKKNFRENAGFGGKIN